MWLKRIALFLLMLLLALACFLLWRLGDRHPGYALDINVQSRPSEIYAGAAALPITLPYFDSWIDKDSNAIYQEGIDQYIDLNDNDRFDPLYLAGFRSPRPATAVNDNVTARALVLKVGKVKMGLLVFDLIGLGNDAVVEIQKRAKAQLQLNHVQVICTHNHQGPDVLGLWGAKPMQSGVNAEFMKNMQIAGLQALQLADESLQLSSVQFARSGGADDMITDTRPPVVKDSDLYLMQLQNFHSGKTICTLLGWGNHVETLWKKNTKISADFVHYWRQAMEQGVQQDGYDLPANDGVSIFVPAAIGGLMTTSAETPIKNHYSGKEIFEPSIEKAQLQGFELARLSHQALRDSASQRISKTQLKILARSIALPLDNRELQMAAALGVVDRGLSSFATVRSEIGLWQLGPATFLHVPGELYPEIVNGGIELPEGHDLGADLVEIPPLRSQMPGDFRWLVGMSNDMIGYIVPYSQWDVTAPYTYQANAPHYGERLSLGPQTAPTLHPALLTLIAEALDNSTN